MHNLLQLLLHPLKIIPKLRGGFNILFGTFCFISLTNGNNASIILGDFDAFWFWVEELNLKHYIHYLFTVFSFFIGQLTIHQNDGYSHLSLRVRESNLEHYWAVVVELHGGVGSPFVRDGVSLYHARDGSIRSIFSLDNHKHLIGSPLDRDIGSFESKGSWGALL